MNISSWSTRCRQNSKVLATGCALVTVLSACSSISEHPKANIEKGIESYEQSKLETELVAIKADLAALKPKINRLVELESGLESIIDSANPTALLTYPNINESDILTEQNGDDNEAPSSPFEDSFITENKVMPSSVSTANATLQAQAAPPIPNELSINNLKVSRNTIPVASQNTSNQIDAKFSSASTSLASNRSTVRNSIASPNTQQRPKLRHSAVQADLRNDVSAVCESSDVNDRYSVHVASFKNRQYAISALEELTQGISAKQLCPKETYIMDVMVNGSLFYSARLGTFSGREQASNYCNQIADLTTYCAVSTNEGEKVL